MTKKPPKVSLVEDSSLLIEKSPRHTKFAAFAEAVRRLTKLGTGVVVHPEAAVPAEERKRYVANLTAAIQGRGIKAPKGYAYRKGWTNKGDVIVYLAKWGG